MVFFVTRGLPKKSYNPVFSENEWSAIIEACHANEVPDEWVADGTCYKDMLINGTNYRIDIIGKNHDDLADGTGKAPLTFQMHDCYATTYAMNSSNTNSGGWTNCAMRSTHLPAILNLMPAEVQAGIRPVIKLTSAGNKSSSILVTSDELFLPSEVEVFGSITYSFAREGTQYAYYQAGNSKVKNSVWRHRSPKASNSTGFCLIDGDGDAIALGAAISYGVAFGFCF